MSGLRWLQTLLLLLGGCGGTARDPPAPPSDWNDIATLRTEGESHYQDGAYDSAEVRFSRALAISRERGDLDAQAELLAWLGSVAYRRADYAAARALLSQALALQQDRGATRHLFFINNMLGLVGYYEGRYYDALERHATAAELADAAGDSVSLAKSWTNVALVQTELGNFDEARRLLLRALPVTRAAGDRRAEGRVLVNLGMLAVRTGDAEAALLFLDEARAPLAAAGDVAGQLNRLGQLGTAYATIGEPGRAIAQLDTALNEARRIDAPQEVASNLEHMASIYRDAGDYARALRMFEQAHLLNDSLGLVDEAAFDLRSSAEIHRELGNHALARRAAERALAIHRQVGARLEVMHDLLLLARLDQEAGDPTTARAHHREASAIARSLNARAPRLAVALASARMADFDRDHAGVLRTLADAAADLEAGGLDIVWETHWLEARAWARQGSLDRAGESARRAAEAVERVRGEFGSGLLRTRYQAAREEVYRDLVDILLRQDRFEEAFEAADASRGRALLDHLATVRTNGGSTVRELAEEERQLLRQMDTITVALDRLAGDRTGADTVSLRADRDRLAADLDRIRAEYALALTRAEERQGGSLALMGGARPSLASVQAALQPGTALLEYFMFPDRLVVFVVGTRTLTTHVRAVDHAALATRIRVVRELAGRPAASGALTAALEALHENLLGPVLEAGVLAGVHTLLVVPQGDLEYVPFAALRARATGRFLVEDFALLHLPSAAAFPILSARARGPVPAGVPVVFAPFPRELPASVLESKAFTRALPRAASRVGAAATERGARETLTRAGVVHLATHGVLNARNPLFSRVELAPGNRADPENDGRLEVHEVNRLRIRAALVFLSGCETGAGLAGATGFSRGEDYATLTRAFLNAGAQNVVATLWRVEDRGAGEFASRFYAELTANGRELESGLGALADVLSRTQREMLRDPAWMAPFYWAGFRLTGTGNGTASPLSLSVPVGVRVGRSDGRH